MNDLRPEEDEARRFFEVLGLTVSPIPTDSGRTPDLWVDGDGRGYLVEVKRRTDTDEFAQALHHLRDGEQGRPLGHDLALERVVRDAHRQLCQFDPMHQRLWIVWLNVDVHVGGHLGLGTAVGTLYGVKQAIMPAERGDGAVSLDCYYARPGAFEKWPQLDAAIVSIPEGFSMCVNEFSPRIEEILASTVARRLAERRAVLVPTERESVGQCFFADRLLDRRDEGAVVDDLRRRYHKPVACLTEPLHHAVVTHVHRSALP